MAKALIFGATGQDGHYLIPSLSSLDIGVSVTTRNLNSPKALKFLEQGIPTYPLDINDKNRVFEIVSEVNADFVFNLAGESSVAESWRNVYTSAQTNGIGALNILEAIKANRDRNPSTRFFQCSSSEMFGDTNGELATELHVLDPKSPYAVSKAFAHHMTRVYRESYGLFTSTGIFFNHESPFRDVRFVSKKITQKVAELFLGHESKLKLGNLDSQRDWSFAGDAVDAMIKIILHEEPDDFVVASGELHTVRDFVEVAFNSIGIKKWQNYIEIDHTLLRPNDIKAVAGDSSKARRQLGWHPKVDFDDLVTSLIRFEIDHLKDNYK